MDLMNWINSHGQIAALVAAALSAGATNLPNIIHFVVTSKWISAWIRSHPQLADEMADAVDREVHAAADKSAAPAGTPQAP